MDFMELLLKRRSVREYTGEEVPEEKIKAILQAGLLSPSGRNKRPWEFVVTDNRDVLDRLSLCRDGAAKMLKKAGCAILVFGDPEKTDVWTEDCSIAMSNMHLMAASLGLGSCWIQGRLRMTGQGETTEEFCRRMFRVPKGLALEAILSVGIPKEAPKARNLQEVTALEEKIHYGSF